MAREELDDRLAALAGLGEPLRRRLYHFVGGQDHPVSRDEAAAGAGVSRSAAAFHLDRLVADGLLETEFRRLSGRRGPGAGRPSKLYRRSGREIAVSLPARRYDLAAEVLADAVTRAMETGAAVATAVRDVAYQCGVRLAGEVGAVGVRAAAAVLADEGYEPRIGPEGIELANCPFSSLAHRHAALVCGMNLALLDGFTRALPHTGLSARLEPSGGHCCVRLTALPAEPSPPPAAESVAGGCEEVPGPADLRPPLKVSPRDVIPPHGIGSTT